MLFYKRNTALVKKKFLQAQFHNRSFPHYTSETGDLMVDTVISLILSVYLSVPFYIITFLSLLKNTQRLLCLINHTEVKSKPHNLATGLICSIPCQRNSLKVKTKGQNV